MKAFVLGAAGFVGENLVERLDGLGFEVDCCGHGGHNKIWSIDKDTDFIFNCVVQKHKEDKMLFPNTELVYLLLEATKNIPYRALIHIGSSSEYGIQNGPLSEKSRCEPSNIYDVTKLAATHLCQVYAKKYNKPIAILRPFSIYGPHDNDYKLIATTCRNIEEGKDTPLYEGSHDWIYIDDFIDAMLKVAHLRCPIKGDIINCGSGHTLSNLEVYNTIVDVMGKGEKKTEMIHSYMKNYDREMWVSDTRYAREQYGIEFKTSFREGIERYINWRNNERN